MKGKWVSFFVFAAGAAGMLAATNCGRSQQLVTVQIQPSSETIGSSKRGLMYALRVRHSTPVVLQPARMEFCQSWLEGAVLSFLVGLPDLSCL